MARPTMSAIETHSAPMKIATAMLPRFSSWREIDVGREPIDDSIAHVHQHHAQGGVDEVQRKDRQLHEVPS